MFQWFHKFVACDEYMINTHRHTILRRLLSFLEVAIFGSKNCISFEKSVLDFCYSEEFDEFVAILQIDLQTEVENRMAAFCLIDALSDILEDWVYDATTEITNSRRNTSETMVGIDDKGVIKMMQKMVGAGIPKALKNFGTPNCPNDPSVGLLNHICWMHVEAITDLEYVKKWYPPKLRIENRGKLHLIHPIFVNWSLHLMLHAIKIDVLGDVSDCTMKKIHSTLAKQAFNTYTSFRWREKFKGNKDSSDDKNNVAFRQLLQTTGTDGSKTEPKTSRKKKRSLDYDCLVNRNTNLIASASSHITSSTSSTGNPTTANNSTTSTVVVNAEPSHKKRKGQKMSISKVIV
mmetsp:Transcript_38112/g.62301  ORF Transcript_38112/g.62301 Transcript_38112/m.62301 type:complete len:347 (-) Transcript_38112:240-1280(-)